jgi:hypothetical protein
MLGGGKSVETDLCLVLLSPALPDGLVLDLPRGHILQECRNTFPSSPSSRALTFSCHRGLFLHMPTNWRISSSLSERGLAPSP